MYVKVLSEEEENNFNSETFWQRHPEIKQLDYTVQDDDKEGLRRLTNKKHPEKSCLYALDKNIYSEFCGEFSFYYKPKVRVAIDGYGWPRIKDINGNPPKWQDIRQAVVALLDRYHEVERHATH